jgi:inorganic pyrophosphatase
MNPGFWSRLDELLATSRLVIDRPKGTRHPRYPEVIFPLDYGYLAARPAAMATA